MSRLSLIRQVATSKGMRESPTPILLFGGPLFSPGTWNKIGVVQALSTRGFNVYECDLSRPQWTLCKQKPDDLVELIHEEINSARLCAPPVALTSGMECVILQKYLESYALAGLVMVNPLPPSVSSACHTLLGGTSRLPKSPACDRAAPIAALAPRLATRARTSAAASIAAAFLLSLADAPVNLEPSPVPMLLIGPPPATAAAAHTADAVLCGTAATAHLHGLTPVHITATLPQHPFPPAGSEGSGGESGDTPASPHTTTICDWVGSHF